MKTFLHQALEKNQQSLNAEIEAQFIAYLELMQKWNRVYNLTAIHDPEESVMLHIIDSLTIQPYLHGNRIIDVGTGAGLPGIPLALVYPEKQFTLLDSNSKKTRFLNQVCYELGIKNVNVVHSRAEDFHPEKGFDSIITRAFASMKVMLAATQHFLIPSGQFLAMKGIYPEQELQEIPSDYNVLAVHRLKIIGMAVERHLVLVKLKEHTHG